MDDPTSAFGFWVDGYGGIHDIESFYSTHSAIANQYLKDNPGLQTDYNQCVQRYRRVQREIFAADYLMIRRGWIRVCKNIQAKFLCIEFYESSVERAAYQRLRDYMQTYCCVESIKVDIHNFDSTIKRFYLVAGTDIRGVLNCVYGNIKRVTNDTQCTASTNAIL